MRTRAIIAAVAFGCVTAAVAVAGSAFAEGRGARDPAGSSWQACPECTSPPNSTVGDTLRNLPPSHPFWTTPENELPFGTKQILYTNGAGVSCVSYDWGGRACFLTPPKKKVSK